MRCNFYKYIEFASLNMILFFCHSQHFGLIFPPKKEPNPTSNHHRLLYDIWLPFSMFCFSYCREKHVLKENSNDFDREKVRFTCAAILIFLRGGDTAMRKDKKGQWQICQAGNLFLSFFFLLYKKIMKDSKKRNEIKNMKNFTITIKHIISYHM